MENELSTIGLLVTLTIALANIMYSVSNNRKTQFINTVTSSRISWMNELRDEISRFIELIPCNEIDLNRILNVVSDFDKSHLKKNAIDMNKVDKSVCRIILMLNPNSKTDQKIVQYLQRITEILKQYRILVLFSSGIKGNSLDNYDLNKRISIKFREELVKSAEELGEEIEVIENIENILLHRIENEKAIKIVQSLINGYILQELINTRTELIEIVQKHLKLEWERVKSESEKGKIKFDSDLIA